MASGGHAAQPTGQSISVIVPACSNLHTSKVRLRANVVSDNISRTKPEIPRDQVADVGSADIYSTFWHDYDDDSEPTVALGFLVVCPALGEDPTSPMKSPQR